MIVNRIIHGDCVDVMAQMPDGCVDLIITSPPYAEQRKTSYGGISPDEYPDWFLRCAEGFALVLRRSGSLVINIKEHRRGGVRDTYVLRTILSLCEQGWLWRDEFIWVKTNPFPTNPKCGFKDGWERLLHFTRGEPSYINKEAVKRPMTSGTLKRLASGGSNWDQPHPDNHNSGMGVVKNNFTRLGGMALPSNVLTHPSAISARGHPACFPRAIPEFFIKAFCPPDGMVLDPFVGSGTTCIAAKQLGRNYVGIDTSEEYCRLSEDRIADSLI